MGKKVVFIESNSNDPRFNLALEQYVFDEMPKDREYFWLWQNHNTIVVGKHQNTAQEINQTYVREHGITVVRRLSGGGAVYHDMGNVNFTFIADTGDMETSVYSNDDSKLLPRPISICEIDKNDKAIRLVYRVAGKGTEEFSKMTTGMQLDIIGPLGNTIMRMVHIITTAACMILSIS